MEPIRDMLSEAGISEQKWRVLRVVEESGPLEQTSIAKKACLLLPSLTRIMHALEEDGLLVREPDSQDRRKSAASITPAGRALINAHASRSNEIFAQLENQFGRRRLETLLDLLEELQQVKF